MVSMESSFTNVPLNNYQMFQRVPVTVVSVGDKGLGDPWHREGEEWK